MLISMMKQNQRVMELIRENFLEMNFKLDFNGKKQTKQMLRYGQTGGSLRGGS